MELSLSKLFSILWRRVGILIICSLVGLCAAFSVSKFLIHPTYTASLKMCVRNANSQGSNLSDLNYYQKVVTTYTEWLDSYPFYEIVSEKSGLNYSPTEISQMVTISVLNNTENFEIKVNAPSPDDAKAIADAIETEAPARVVYFEKDAAVKTVESARIPVAPSSPNVGRNSVLGFLVGLILSGVVVVLMEMLDTRIKSEEDLSLLFDIPILGTVPGFGDPTSKKKSASKPQA